MGYGIDYFAEKLKSEFNVSRLFIGGEAKDIISCWCLEEVVCFPLEKLLSFGSDIGRINKYVSFIEDMYENGNDDIKDIVQFVLLEYLLDLENKEIKRRLYKYLSKRLCEAAKEVEYYISSKGY